MRSRRRTVIRVSWSPVPHRARHGRRAGARHRGDRRNRRIADAPALIPGRRTQDKRYSRLSSMAVARQEARPSASIMRAPNISPSLRRASRVPSAPLVSTAPVRTTCRWSHGAHGLQDHGLPYGHSGRGSFPGRPSSTASGNRDRTGAARPDDLGFRSVRHPSAPRKQPNTILHHPEPGPRARRGPGHRTVSSAWFYSAAVAPWPPAARGCPRPCARFRPGTAAVTRDTSQATRKLTPAPTAPNASGEIPRNQ